MLKTGLVHSYRNPEVALCVNASVNTKRQWNTSTSWQWMRPFPCNNTSRTIYYYNLLSLGLLLLLWLLRFYYHSCCDYPPRTSTAAASAIPADSYYCCFFCMFLFWFLKLLHAVGAVTGDSYPDRGAHHGPHVVGLLDDLKQIFW